ncbi:uncharacterized protein [Aegilops tauschii subsp. strangulata]|uniref:uncharacterized protein n=1 Tax=Aegilops tauschii subsp. strangulata TaxID=200361 RepID=UPI003CC88F97
MRFRLGFSNAFGVGSDGLSGGLVFFWNNDSTVSLESYNNSHIDVSIQNENLGEKEWRFTGFYGEPVRSKRKNSWDLMKYLRKKSDNPWFCAGDFNEILDASEQIGGNVRDEWKMDGFRDAVEECRMDDLGYIGLPYTWDNRQQGIGNIKVRLDRGLGDDKFQERFDSTSVQHIQTTESDHCALIISGNLQRWSRNESGSVPKQLKILREKLENVQMFKGHMLLGRGWKYFCGQHKIVPGDLVVFKLSDLGLKMQIFNANSSNICTTGSRSTVASATSLRPSSSCVKSDLSCS